MPVFFGNDFVTITKDEKSIKNITLIADKEIDEIIEIDMELEKEGIDGIEKKELIKNIERKMLNYAKDLQFEKAALLRDQLEKINN